MKLPETEKQKITATVKNITNVFRKTFHVEIRTYCRSDNILRLTMGDEYVQVGISYSVQEFDDIGHYIMRHYPGDLALYFGIYWQNQLELLYSFYSKRLKEKAFKVMGWS